MNYEVLVIPEANAQERAVFDAYARRSDELRQKRLAAAEARSRALLLRHLSRKQRAKFEETGGFTVANWLYELRVDYNADLWRDDGNRQCMSGGLRLQELPVYDRMLALKLILERDPATFYVNYHWELALCVVLLAVLVACVVGLLWVFSSYVPMPHMRAF